MHHGHRLPSVVLCVTRVLRDGLHDRLFGINEASLPCEPPRTLWGKEDTDEDGDGPNPLQGKGNLVRPFGGVVDQRLVDTRGLFGEKLPQFQFPGLQGIRLLTMICPMTQHKLT